MIYATFNKNEQNQWVSFEISGHANYAQFGSDIVCSAVTALAFATVNSLEQLVGYRPILDIDAEQGGYLYCESLADLTPKQQEMTQLLLTHLYNGLQAIQEEYKDFVSVNQN